MAPLTDSRETTLTARAIQEGPPGLSSSPSAEPLGGGAIASIVIGSVIGVLLIMWLFRSCQGSEASVLHGRASWYEYEEPKRYHSRPRRGRGHSHQTAMSRNVLIPPAAVYGNHVGAQRYNVKK